MDTWILSIGLNVGRAEPTAQLSETLAQVTARFGPLHALGMLRGEWEGVAERTVHVAVRATGAEIARGAPALCRGLRQSAIAVTRRGMENWHLYSGTSENGPLMGGGSVSDFPVAIPAEVL